MFLGRSVFHMKTFAYIQKREYKEYRAHNLLAIRVMACAL